MEEKNIRSRTVKNVDKFTLLSSSANFFCGKFITFLASNSGFVREKL